YLLYGCLRALYNVYFSPLSRFPGPKLRAGFYFPYYYERLRGNYIISWRLLHEEYGEVVRISPDNISIISPEAWRDIYGLGKELQKDWRYYNRDPLDKVDDLLRARDKDHARMRRSMNHAFSEQALRSQEDIITGYVSLMISKLHLRAKQQSPVDATRWLNATTFDITGDLTFGEPFGALDADAHYPWIEHLFDGLKWVILGTTLSQYPVIGVPFVALLRSLPALAQAREKYHGYVDRRLGKRLSSKTDRNDFIGHMTKHTEGKGFALEELRLTSSILILAGSETSATCLSGAIYFLLKSPDWLSKLSVELRSAFKSESEITFQSLAPLKVLNSIIQESLRMYPPLPVDLPRMTPEEGATISGTYIPPNTRVGIPMYPAFRSELNFKNSDAFAPNRWLGDEEYASDRRSVLQPFSMGSRNCIGQNFAWAEMRSILARLVWNFEMELCPESEGWDQGQRVYFVWSKPPLMIKLKARSEFERYG
ncbi:putative benzoate 4-monooxygenase cytochrome P450, partial [Didymella exigua CBS 183.55]